VRENRARRAAELRGVLERLGPAYVKIAQAVSPPPPPSAPAPLPRVTNQMFNVQNLCIQLPLHLLQKGNGGAVWLSLTQELDAELKPVKFAFGKGE